MYVKFRAQVLTLRLIQNFELSSGNVLKTLAVVTSLLNGLLVLCFRYNSAAKILECTLLV